MLISYLGIMSSQSENGLSVTKYFSKCSEINIYQQSQYDVIRMLIDVQLKVTITP